MRADPVKKGLLYAGTETGVYVSFNDGKMWQPLQLNLPTAAVRDLAVHDNDLIAATHGRSFWILDNLTPLRQITKDAVKNEVCLFKPETAIRIRRSENHDTPLPPETPVGQNPPAGAFIDYYLSEKPEGEVTLDIYVNSGNLVRHFSSYDTPRPIGSKPYFMLEWLPKFKAPTTHPGLNRFVWDLQYPPPPTSRTSYSMQAIIGEGTREVPEGPLVLPGEYKIVLTVDGKSYSQKLDLQMDPRVKISNKDLKDQLKLGIDIWNSSSDQMRLNAEIDSVLIQLKGIENKKDEKISKNIIDLTIQLKKLQRQLSSSSPASLETDVFSADREPTEQMFCASAHHLP